MWNPKRVEGWVKVTDIKLGDAIRYIINKKGSYSPWIPVMKIVDDGDAVIFHLGYREDRPTIRYLKIDAVRVNRFVTEWNRRK